jgi:hypothetical protein
MSIWRVLRDFWHRIAGLGAAAPLCDTCKWDYGGVCKRPERPNAYTCPDYKRR